MACQSVCLLFIHLCVYMCINTFFNVLSLFIFFKISILLLLFRFIFGFYLTCILYVFLYIYFFVGRLLYWFYLLSWSYYWLICKTIFWSNVESLVYLYGRLTKENIVKICVILFNTNHAIRQERRLHTHTHTPKKKNIYIFVCENSK